MLIASTSPLCPWKTLLIVLTNPGNRWMNSPKDIVSRIRPSSSTYLTSEHIIWFIFWLVVSFGNCKLIHGPHRLSSSQEVA